MEYYLEPHKIALLKRIVLEKESLEKLKYTPSSLFAHFFASFAYKDSFLAFLLDLQDKNFFKIPRYWFNPAYFQLSPSIPNAWVNAIPPDKVPKAYFKNLWSGIIKKINKDEILTIDEVLTIRDKFLSKDQQGLFYTFLSLGFAFPDGTKKITSYLKKYVSCYMSGELVGIGTTRYYNYGLQRQGFEKIIGDNAQIYGSTNLVVSLNEIWSNLQSTNLNDHPARLSQTRFWETLLAMELEDLIKITQVISPDSARISILEAKAIPVSDGWNDNFYSIASNLSYFNFVKSKKELSRKGQLNEESTNITWDGLNLDTKSGQAEYGGKKHHFLPTGPHFKVIKRLLDENGGDVTYEKFFKCLGGDMEKDPKVSRIFVRQKIRDIRKYFGINRKLDPSKDIFIETGSGFKLAKITTGSVGITE